MFKTKTKQGRIIMDFKEIIYTKDAGIAKITINRPKRYNAFTALTLEEMYAALRDAWVDNEVGVVVLTGAGDKAFVAGADISELATCNSLTAKNFFQNIL